MIPSFDGQVALITGGGKGIGFGIASALAKLGADVAIAGRHKQTLEHAVSTLGGRGFAVSCDVRDENSVRDCIAAVVERAGRLDILVNNAGIGLLQTPLSETQSDAWLDVIDTNLNGAFYAAKAAWPHLVSAKGQILNVSSIAGTQGFSGASAYCASKFGLLGLTEVLKIEGAQVGVRVLAICPGPVDTDIWGSWATGNERSRMMRPDDLARTAISMLAAPRNTALSPLVVTNAVSPWNE